MRRKLSERELLAIAMGAPIEMWLSFGALVAVSLLSFLEAPFSQHYMRGGTKLAYASGGAAVGVFWAMSGDFRGLILAIGIFAIRSVSYYFYAFQPIAKLFVYTGSTPPQSDWLWSACILPVLLLMPCASPRAVRHLRRYWPLIRRGA